MAKNVYIIRKWARYLNTHSAVRCDLSPLVFFTDRRKTPHIHKVIASLPEKTMVIIRDYDHPSRLTYAKTIITLAKKQGHMVLLAGDVAMAIRLKVDGIHVPATYWCQFLLKKKHPKWIVTCSVHSQRELKNIQHNMVDVVFFSPIFRTTSHPEAIGKGYATLYRIATSSKIPLYALGGIKDTNIRYLKHSAMAGIAAIDAFNHVAKGNCCKNTTMQ